MKIIFYYALSNVANFKDIHYISGCFETFRRENCETFFSRIKENLTIFLKYQLKHQAPEHTGDVQHGQYHKVFLQMPVGPEQNQQAYTRTG